MNNSNPKNILIAALAVVVVMISLIVVWKTIRGMQPGAIYEGAHAPNNHPSPMAERIKNLQKKPAP